MEVERNLPKPNKRNSGIIHCQGVLLCTVFWVKFFNMCSRVCLCRHVDELLVPGTTTKMALMFYTCWGACSSAFVPGSCLNLTWDSFMLFPRVLSLVAREMGAWPPLALWASCRLLWSTPSVSSPPGWTSLEWPQSLLTWLPLDTSPSSQPSFGHSLIALCLSCVVALKTVPRTWGEAAPVQSRVGQLWTYISFLLLLV